MHRTYVRVHRYCRRHVRRIVTLLPTRRNRGRMVSAWLFFSSFFSIYIFKLAFMKVSDELHKYSILIVSVLDEPGVHTVTGADPRRTLEDLLVPKKWAGRFVRMRHAILFSDVTVYDRFAPWYVRHLRRASHVHVHFVPALSSHAAKVHYAVSIHRDLRFIMLWNFAQMRIPLSDFHQLLQFAKSSKPFVVHEEITYASSDSSKKRVSFKKHSYTDLLSDPSRWWDVVMLRVSLFESIGGLFNFSYAGYTCVGIRAHFEGAALWSARIGVPITSARATTRGKNTLKMRDEANVMESCGIPERQTEKLLPLHVIRHARGKVALIHEMIPLPNQGGNIRLIEILDVLLANGFHVEIFVRENIVADTVISIKDTHSVRVWADNFKLTRFRTSLRDFDCVISAMWFWNRPDGAHRQRQFPLTIPIVVEHLIGDNNLHISHVVVTDDIHASRCFQTETDSKEYCSYVRRQEESVWTSFRMLKIFVSMQDMKFAQSVAPEATDTMTFIPYIIAPKKSDHSLAPRRIQTSFKLAYFGKAHPANIGALKTLLRAYRAKENRFFHQVTELWIVGDEKWIRVKEVKDAVRPSRETRVRVVGELEDLDTFMESVDLALAPVTVGGTGVSSKLFKCLELNVPFVSTSLGMRGFDCDAECRNMFFTDKVEDVLTVGLKNLFDTEHRVKARLKMREMARQLTSKNVGENVPFMQKLSMTDDEYISSSMSTTRRNHKMTAHTNRCQDNFLCRACEFTENCRELCDMHRQKLHAEIILLSVYTSLLGGAKEDEFLKYFVLDIFNQKFDLGSWEIVVASSDGRILSEFRNLITLFRTCEDNTPVRIRIVHLWQDDGLYETWDLLIRNFTSGKFLTNWNADDRKHPQALAKKVSVLQRSPTIDVVSASVFTSTVPNQDWRSCQNETRRNRDSQCAVWFSERGRYALSAFVQTDPKTMSLTKIPQNYPHNAPVYRRRLHEHVGYFSSDRVAILALNEKRAPTCFDWKFWVTAASSGAKFYNIDNPLEVYYVRLDSHGRRDEQSADACIDSVFQTLHRRGLYNNAFYWRFNFIEQFKWYSRLLFIIDGSENSKIPDVELDFMRWLNENGHEIRVLDGAMTANEAARAVEKDITGSTSMNPLETRTFEVVPKLDIAIFSSNVDLQRRKTEKWRDLFKTMTNLKVRTLAILGPHSSQICAETKRCTMIDIAKNGIQSAYNLQGIISIGASRVTWSQNKKLINLLSEATLS